MFNLLLSILFLLTPSERDSILALQPHNAEFWENTFQQYSGDTLTYVEHIFQVIPEEDRDSMTAAVLSDHVLGAMDARDRWFQDLPDSVFTKYLLEYRISAEPLSAYRSSLEGWLERRVQQAQTPYETAGRIQDVVRDNIALTAATGPIMAPTQIIPVGRASREGRWVLLCAAMRSMGIPVRPVKGWFPGTDRNLYRFMDVWTGEEWQSLGSGMPPVQYVKAAVAFPSMRNVTGEYRETGILNTSPLADPAPGWWVDLMIPSGDDTVTVDGIQLDPFRSSSAELGTGEFLVRVRFSDNGIQIGEWIQAVTISPGEVTTVDLTEAQYQITPLP